MDKIGIPRGIFYYYYKDIWISFFKYLKIPYIISPRTNKDIMDMGIKAANDEMCLSLKVYLGHVLYLENKCNYILVPRIDNYKINNQTCTNFLGAYDIVNNLSKAKILNYNINYQKHQTLKKGLIKIGKDLKISKHKAKKAYKFALMNYIKKREQEIKENENKLNSDKTKVLLVSHPYVIYDEMIGMDIIKYLESNNIVTIFSDKFNDRETNKLSKIISKDLYFKYSKDNLGALVYTNGRIDGVIFLSAFPCGLDCLANELAMRKIKLPYINLVIDDNASFTGVETRLESFIDVLKGGIND